MNAWQERVVEEHRELNDRVCKLRAFLSTDAVVLSLVERDRLVRQRVFMEAYLQVLTERIAAFPTTRI